jgi:hypothetical protein
MMVLSRPVDPEPVKTVVRETPQNEDLSDTAKNYDALSFDEIYQLPAGPRGLDFTKKTQALKGAKVRLDGFMVKHFHEDAGVFLFAGVPSMHNQAEYILAESLPTSLVHVLLPEIPGRTPSWIPQRVTVLGTLELGMRQEIDGRLSHVRVIADHIADTKTLEAIELRKPLALQRDRMKSGVRTVFRSSQSDSTQTNTPTNHTAPSSP